MPRTLDYRQTAEKLINQLSEDTALIEWSDEAGTSIDRDKTAGPNGNEPSSTKVNGSTQKGAAKNNIHNNIIPNISGAVNDKLYEVDTIHKIDDWNDPIPIESVTSSPPFPIHCLPVPLRDFAIAVAEHTQTPVDMAGVAALGTAAACLQGKYVVQGKVGHIEPLNGYYSIIAKPGERKSAVCAIFEEPIKAYEKRKNDAFALEIAQSANIRQVLEKELEALKNAVAKGKKTYADMEAKQEEINNHHDIKPMRLICGDVTPEALTSLLADNHGRMAMFSAEGGIFDILKGLYSTVTNIDTFLKAHCGDSIRVDRKGRAPEFIEKPCLTTLLFIQPDVLRELVGNDTFRGRGLVARFLYSYPQSTVGSRRYKTCPIPLEVEDLFKRLCENMLNIQKKEPGMLVLNEYSEALSERFYDELEPRLGKDGDLEHMADWAGKLHGAVLRIAGLIQVVFGVWCEEEDFADNPFDITITEQSMDYAIQIGKYFLAHAQVCYGMMGVDENMEGAKYILERLMKQKPEQFTTRDLLRMCKKFKATKDLAEPLTMLVEREYIREITPTYTGIGRPPGAIYAVNPKIYQMCNSLVDTCPQSY